jgi:hypothetical protein
MPYYGQPNLDARGDLGYGRLEPRFHVSRSRGESYPYLEPDPYEEDLQDFEPDEETLDAISKKSAAYTQLDPFAINKTNPFYYGAGNLKLSDCFWRTDRALSEVHAMGTSMVPIPHLHRGRRVSLGPSLTGDSHAQYLTPGSFRPTGSQRGWSSSPPPIGGEPPDGELDVENFEEYLRVLLGDED